MKRHLALSALLAALIVAMPQHASAQWSTETKISVGDTAARLNENMTSCIAVSGATVHVVWWDAKTDSSAIYYRRSTDAGDTWLPDVKLVSNLGVVDFPSIAANAQTVHIMFRSNVGGNNTSYYKRSTDGGATWGSNVALASAYWWPAVTCKGQFVFAALNDNIGSNSEVFFKRSTDGGATWQTSVQISNATGRSEDPSISAANGFVHMAWNDNRTGIMQTWYRRSTDNGVTWGPETQLTNSTVFAYTPNIYAGGANVDLVWGDRRSGTYEIYYKLSKDYGNTWGSEQALTSGGITSVYPVVADEGMYKYVVYPQNGTIFYRHSTDEGSSWAAPFTLVSAVNKASNPFLVASFGNLYAIWVDQRNGYHAIYFRKYQQGSSSFARLDAPSIIDFGSVRFGKDRDTTILIRNIGSDTLNILEYRLRDSLFTFSLVDTFAHSILPEDSASITLRYSPVKRELNTAFLTISTDETGNPVKQIQLAGKGIGPHLTASNIDFGEVLCDTVEKTLFIFNDGEVQADVFSYTLGGSPAITLIDTIPHHFPTKDTARIRVRFIPTASQHYTNSLTIRYGTEFDRLQVLFLGAGAYPKAQISDAVVNFGSVDTVTKVTKEITMSNTSCWPIGVEALSIVGSSDFTVISPFKSFTIAPSAAATFLVQFAPSSADQKSALLTIRDSNGGTQQVVLSGFGVDVGHSGIRAPQSSTPFNLYPNPSTRSITILKDGAFRYSIIDLLGHTLLAGTAYDAATCDVRALSAGVYVAWVESEGKRVMRVVRKE